MKNFQVKILFGALYTEIVLKANNGTNAMAIAKKMFKDGRVIAAQEAK